MAAARVSPQVTVKETLRRWGLGGYPLDSSEDEDCRLLGVPNVTPGRNKPKTTPPGRGCKRFRSKVSNEETEQPSAAGAAGELAAWGEFDLEGHIREQENMINKLGANLSKAAHWQKQHMCAFRKIESSFDAEKEANEKQKEVIEKLQSALNEEEEKNQELTREKNCKICFQAPREVILFPCKHFEFCKKCVKMEKQASQEKLQPLRCPLDRIPVMAKIKLKCGSERD